MSGFKGIMKDGWHPNKSRDGGKKESWRGDFKGINQVAGWMGKGKDKDKDGETETHVSRPISSLKDPSSFGPPPKHIKYHGAAALPNQTTPDRTGIGAPLPQSQVDRQNAELQRQEEEEEEERLAQEAEDQKPAGPPVPFRANRSGFDPSHLPPPPARRMASPADSAVSATPASSKPKPSAPPSVPPRVPPRTNSTASSHSPTPPPAYSSHPTTEQPSNGYLNQAAASRLSQAGVSVPGLGIGNNGTRSPSNTTSPPALSNLANQASVNELQSRFSQMRTNSPSASSPVPSPPVRGNFYNSSNATEQQQQQQQQQQPSISAFNIESARSAFNGFREQHGDKIDSGKQKLGELDQKYGLTQRANAALNHSRSSTPSRNESQAPPIPPHPSLSRTGSGTEIESIARKKGPPPPPPKKAGMRSTPVNATPGSPAPPPLPLSTKPR